MDVVIFYQKVGTPFTKVIQAEYKGEDTQYLYLASGKYSWRNIKKIIRKYDPAKPEDTSDDG